MKVIVCLDNQKGILFNHRRQSRDKNIIQDIISLTEGNTLKVSAYSNSLFQGMLSQAKVCDDVLAETNEGEFCYLEQTFPTERKNQVEELVLYWWNREYPADTHLEWDYPSELSLTESIEFVGTSHEKITRQIWKREENE